MKSILRLATVIIFLFAFGASAWAESTVVYVLDLNDEVGPKMWKQTKRACEEAKDLDASLMIIRVNTYGGEVAAADSIRTAIMRQPMPTVAFVDPNAASAGALITLACDSVFMSMGASYGASTVVNGNGEPMPDKYQSYMKSIMRSTAESHGKRWSEEDSAWVWRRDPTIAEGFVTPEKVITLTPEEAIKKGYAEGIASSTEEIAEMYSEKPYRIERFEPTATEDILGFLANAAVRTVLIMLIIGGLYMEMHSPGLGFAACVSLVAAVLYFLPAIVSGTMAAWVVIMFIVGVILLALEWFVIPGFGVCGITGIIAVIASVVGGMLNQSSIESPYAVDIVNAIGITALGIILAFLAVWYLTSKHGPKWVRRVSTLQATQKISEGYIGVDASISEYVGKEGVAVTDLRPAGKIEIEGLEFDAVSLSGYIDAHRTVKAVKFENAQLYVREL